MELVNGPTLADRIAMGAMPLSDALPIARQIADALETAHDKGIVHRDLKPGNVTITPDGIVKVLDFGLAKAIGPDGSTATSDLANSPTLTSPATQLGVILGTASYMSPEQAQGRAVDRRTDIWAFGVVLFEMLSGKRLFDGETVTEAIAAVIKDPMRLERLPAETPPALRKLIDRCLERDPKLRLRDIGEARIALQSRDVVAPAPVSTDLTFGRTADCGAERDGRRARRPGRRRGLPPRIAHRLTGSKCRGAVRRANRPGARRCVLLSYVGSPAGVCAGWGAHLRDDTSSGTDVVPARIAHRTPALPFPEPRAPTAPSSHRMDPRLASLRKARSNTSRSPAVLRRSCTT